jgi:hypothetical protein
MTLCLRTPDAGVTVGQAYVGSPAKTTVKNPRRVDVRALRVAGLNCAGRVPRRRREDFRAGVDVDLFLRVCRYSSARSDETDVLSSPPALSVHLVCSTPRAGVDDRGYSEENVQLISALMAEPQVGRASSL